VDVAPHCSVLVYECLYIYTNVLRERSDQRQTQYCSVRLVECQNIKFYDPSIGRRRRGIGTGERTWSTRALFQILNRK